MKSSTAWQFGAVFSVHLCAQLRGIAHWNQTKLKISEGELSPLKVEDVRNIMGLAFKEIFNQLFPRQPAQIQSEIGLFLEEFEAEVLASDGGKTYPFVNETIQVIQSLFPIGIVSNCQAGYIENFLRHHPNYQLKGFIKT